MRRSRSRQGHLFSFESPHRAEPPGEQLDISDGDVRSLTGSGRRRPEGPDHVAWRSRVDFSPENAWMPFSGPSYVPPGRCKPKS